MKRDGEQSRSYQSYQSDQSDRSDLSYQSDRRYRRRRYRMAQWGFDEDSYNDYWRKVCG